MKKVGNILGSWANDVNVSQKQARDLVSVETM